MCDDHWDLTDASVVCKQLGYSRYSNHNISAYMHSIDLEFLTLYCNSDAQSFRYAEFGQGNGPIHLDDLNCTGGEQSLIDCPYDSVTSDCCHIKDASVRCNTSKILKEVVI